MITASPTHCHICGAPVPKAINGRKVRTCQNCKDEGKRLAQQRYYDNPANRERRIVQKREKRRRARLAQGVTLRQCIDCGAEFAPGKNRERCPDCSTLRTMAKHKPPQYDGRPATPDPRVGGHAINRSYWLPRYAGGPMVVTDD